MNCKIGIPVSTQQCYVLQMEYVMSTAAVPMVTVIVSILNSLVQEEESVHLSLMDSTLVTVLDVMQSLHVKRTVLVTYAVLDHLAMPGANVITLE